MLSNSPVLSGSYQNPNSNELEVYAMGELLFVLTWFLVMVFTVLGFFFATWGIPD